MASSISKMKLPDRLVTKKQLREVIHETENILDQAVQGHIRKEQTGDSFDVDKPSQLLQELLILHDMKLSIESLRKIKDILHDIENKAVTVRVVLSAEATADVSTRIVRWFRQSMDTPILMRFGIQPGIAGGCIVYTSNHRYDFSLKTKIKQSPVTIRQALDSIK